MKLVVPKEIATGENRVGVTPDSIPSLKKMGFEVFVESNAGLASSFTNEDYKIILLTIQIVFLSSLYTW